MQMNKGSTTTSGERKGIYRVDASGAVCIPSGARDQRLDPYAYRGNRTAADQLRPELHRPGLTIRTALRGVALVALALLAATPSRAAVPTTDELLSAIVQVRSTVPDSARTARSLGTERSGSGIVIDGNGLVVTVGYLVLEADDVSVVSADERVLPAEIVAYDHASGLGLLRADPSIARVPMRLGDSTGLEQGHQLLVASYGGTRAARPAILVEKRDFAGYWEYLLENALFTMPPHPLFGGAALVTPEGTLVGIGSLAVQDAYRGEPPLPGNMFIPVDRLKRVLADLLTSGRSATGGQPWLGIYTEEIAGRLLVRRLAEEGPADAAGIVAGDIIVAVAGAPVTSLADFYRKVWALGDPGITVPLTVLQGGDLRELTVTSGDRYEWLRLR